MLQSVIVDMIFACVWETIGDIRQFSRAFGKPLPIINIQAKKYKHSVAFLG